MDGQLSGPEQNTGTHNRYIGSPNGVVVCIDEYHDGRMSGRMYHLYDTEPVVFDGLDQAFREMERLYDRLNFPMRANKDRAFGDDARSQPPPPGKQTCRERMVKVMNDEQLLKRTGDLGTFIIRVQHRQHNSWQGQITWVEKDEKQNFRSALELMRMIDHAVGTDED